MKRVKPVLELDTVAEAKKLGSGRAIELLMEAQNYHSNMSQYLMDRERNKRYCYGDQWGDIITVDGEKMTEEKYIRMEGTVPMKHNLIRRLVKNVLGYYRGQGKVPICHARDRDEQQLGETMSTLLEYNHQLNRMSHVLSRTMEEYLIGGFVVHRKWYGWRRNRLDCWTDYVQPDKFIIDSNMRDFRGWDCSFVGELHDISRGELLERFAHNPQDYARLAAIYDLASRKNSFVNFYSSFGYSLKQAYTDFLIPDDPSLCRVIEVWRKEQKPRYRCHDYNNGDVFKIDVEDYETMVGSVNARRIEQGVAAGMAADDIPLIKAEWFIDDYWYYYYLTPFGDILEEGESPYSHKEHPYVFLAYPFIDGEIHSFVADVIDQQRYVNQLITLHYWIMKASAKGVMIAPEECFKGYSIEKVAEEWTRFNGVILYKPSNSGQIPQQIANNSTNIGIGELLQVQLKFFEDISGVNGAMQGKASFSGESGSHAQAMMQNGATSLLDLLESFSMFVQDGAYKDVKNMQQYYDERRVINIAGRKATLKAIDPRRVLDAEYDMSIEENTSTLSWREMANEFLLELWRSGQVPLEMILETGKFPYGEQLLQRIQSQQQQLEQGQVPDALPAELQQQVAQGANPQAVQQLYGALRGQAA